MNRIFKLILGCSLWLLLSQPNDALAQKRVFSDAEGVTVFWNNSPASPPMQELIIDQNTLDAGRIYASREGETVFLFPSITDSRSSGVIPVPSFDFEGTPIRWYLLNQDSTFSDIDLEYMTKNYSLLQRDWLVHSDGSIYQLFQSGINEGSVLQRIDSRTGELNWINIHNLATDGQIETDLSLFERANGDVEVTGYRLFSNAVPNFFPAGLGLRKVYSHSSGAVADKFYTQFEQGGLTGRNTNGRFGRILPIIEDESYLSIDQYITDDNQYTYLVRSMDSRGKEIDTLNRISRAQFIDVDKYVQCDARKINEQLYVFGASQHAFFSDTASFLNELIWLNEQGQIVNRQEYTKALNYASYFNVDVYGDRIFLTAITQFDAAADDFGPQASFVVLDLEGNIIKQASRFQVNGQYAEALQAVPLDEPDSYLYAVRFRDDSRLVYLREDADGRITEVGSIIPKVDDLELTPFRLARNSDGDILNYMKIRVEITEVDPVTQEEIKEKVGNWLFTYAIDGDNLGLQTTSTSEALIAQEAKVFPNPGTGLYQISWTAPFSGELELTDMMGRTLRSAALQDSEITTLDITDLESGIYLLNLVGEDSRQKITYKIVKL